MRKFVVAALLSCVMSSAQTPSASAPATSAKSLTFDVVSIRENPAVTAGALQKFGPTPDGYKMVDMQLLLPIMTAYVPQTGAAAFFTPDQIVGLPDWAQRNHRYDIDAKVSEEDLPDWQKPSQQPAMLRAMLQHLLEDRCKMVVHREVKEVAVYSLVVAKGGPKMKPSDPSVPPPDGIKLPWGGVLVPSPGNGDGSVNLYGVSTKSLATLLGSMGNMVGRPIQDKTGLTGTYDILLKPMVSMARQNGGQDGGIVASDPGGSVDSVVEALGLKLESTKAPVETLVIDHIEPPSQN